MSDTLTGASKVSAMTFSFSSSAKATNGSRVSIHRDNHVLSSSASFDPLNGLRVSLRRNNVSKESAIPKTAFTDGEA